MPLAVIVLGLTVFSLGTTEFMIAGLLSELAADFEVPVSQAGWLISVFALGIVVGGPLIVSLTTRIPRKGALLGLLVVFIVGEVVATLAGSFEVLMTARVVTAVAHGGFFGIGAVLAADLVPPDKRARAVSIMFSGLTIATMAGVPLGTFLGQQFGWRTAFGVIAILGLIDLIGLALVIPRHGGRHEHLNLRRELAALRQPRVGLALATTMLSQAGLYAAFTYIAPVLVDLTGFTSAWVAPLLALFGLGSLVGSLAGGWLADRSLMVTLCVGLVALTAVLAAFSLTARSQPAFMVTLFVFGVGAFVINPALQTRVLNLTQDAPTLASATNTSAFNVGNALGPWLGGLAISGGAGLLAPSRIGAGLVLAAIMVTGASLLADRRRPAPSLHVGVRRHAGASATNRDNLSTPSGPG